MMQEEHKLRVLRGVFFKFWLTSLFNRPGHVSRLPVFLDIMYPEYSHACHDA
jgi:hypothetical protein